MPDNPEQPPVIVQHEVVQPSIHRSTAFVMYAAAVVQGLCAARHPTSKEEGEKIVSYAHWLANRLCDGPLPEGGQ